jgi:Holliday junction resolvase RusA-like endonuclease
MDPVVFSMSGVVKGKGRPRATVRGGFARLYTPAETRQYENAARAVAVQIMAGRAPFEGPLSVSLRLRFSPPKSTTKARRARLLSGEEAYLGSIDVDNAAKALLDAFNGVCWGDDVQIVRLFVTKVAAEKPGIDVRIEPLAPQPCEVSAHPRAGDIATVAELQIQPAQQEGAR